MTRVYIPTTLAGLAHAQEHGTLIVQETSDGSSSGGDAGAKDGLANGTVVPAHAVTGAVREWYVEGNLEEVAYSAMIDAAEASLHLLALAPQVPRRRVVVALDVPEELVKPGGEHRSSVRLTGPVELSKVVSVHVDEVESEATIVAAVDALASAAGGDEDARFQLDEAEACDLLWYDISEIDDLLP
jgi:hypothetical protein